jgi:phosphotransferase system HPr-like phosphotransfer protein
MEVINSLQGEVVIKFPYDTHTKPAKRIKEVLSHMFENEKLKIKGYIKFLKYNVTADSESSVFVLLGLALQPGDKVLTEVVGPSKKNF